MEDQFLNDLGKLLVELVKENMAKPQNRFSKSPRLPKTPAKYNTIASKSLRDSVEYRLQGQDIYILMNDYGVDYVYNPLETGGSWPGEGRYAVGKGTGRSELLPKLEQWIKDKGIVPRSSKTGRFVKRTEDRYKSMAFAIRKNLFKRGFAGIALFDQEFQEKALLQADRLLDKPEYREALTNEFIDGLFDKISVFGTQQYNLIFGE